MVSVVFLKALLATLQISGIRFSPLKKTPGVVFDSGRNPPGFSR
jgi:hypothetical protein